MQQESTERLRTRQPIPAEPFAPPPRIPRARRPRRVGSVRIPLAGPYHPRATLFRFPDGRLLWTLRLWEEDRVVRRVFASSVLLRFAHLNGLASLESDLEALLSEAVSHADRR
ncbi:MAG: hypothetical protein WB778_08865 [Thermoplasmata archaeon]